ncbi:alpha/beta hydrolase [Leeuwenhoekiella marinoflava]|uniref:Acetyl xylan esterase AXE1 n=2 Tax=Leeuwenhoekiella marinoflava TaxID=988 RepID=A0A4Q0PP21_9FLAO|nr:acetylxylan esterase [Leeuwenhoekiella marinoflava]RXG32194.1 acetyl xylan esterase AXE1 [Leeuwenhoekiella marinoflava]SHE83796.1 Acetyl xylan esterase (AXE1) [Leeuwenhoekiella marinoflava DSM 3653]
MINLKFTIHQFLLTVSISLGLGFTVIAQQTSDTKFKKPVTETIQKIESLFDIEVIDDRKLLEDKELDYADWRIEQGNLEVSLTNVLLPFNLTYFKQADGTYQIRKFEHHKISIDKAENKLAFLAKNYSTLAEWKTRKASLKTCMRETFGLNNAPKTPDSKPILTKKRNYKGYSVENIGIEILPGVYATGSVYKPYPLKQKAAVIITPNGHFLDGRYRKDEQIRCAMLAKMGAVVINYDLFAWGESELQFPVENHQNSIASTVQVLTGIRLLDYALKLKYADPERVGVTGGSGGGSHTMFLAAIDDRVKVSVPVVMVSSHFSGGCPCESGRGIHLCGKGTNNAEIAALAAPKPQLIISDGEDWTYTVPELEFPFIQNSYGFYGKRELVENAHFPKEGHDYGYSKRMAMYPFMAKYLDLDLKVVKDFNGKIDESEVIIEDKEAFLVFGKSGKKLPNNALKNIDRLYEMFGEKNQKNNDVEN